MKTLIVGTGVIGVIYGWALSEAGADVTHFVRAGKADQFPEGVTLDLLDERKGFPPRSIRHYSIRCAETVSPSDGYELVIVPTNGQQVAAAVRSIAPLTASQQTGGATVLTFSGNWEGLAGLDAVLPRERLLLGYPDGGGTVREGVYWTNLGAEVHLGRLEGQSPERLERVRALFEQAGMKPDLQQNMLHWLWVHNAGVIGFAAGLAKYGRLDPYLADRDLVYRSIRATQELYALCERRGVDLSKYPEIGYMKLPLWLTAFLLKRNFRRNESMQRYTAHATSQGNRKESKYFYEQMMSTAKELNQEMPEMEELGKYFD
jgi:2-dehydropantoate 2-reductase